MKAKLLGRWWGVAVVAGVCVAQAFGAGPALAGSDYFEAGRLDLGARQVAASADGGTVVLSTAGRPTVVEKPAGTWGSVSPTTATLWAPGRPVGLADSLAISADGATIAIGADGVVFMYVRPAGGWGTESLSPTAQLRGVNQFDRTFSSWAVKLSGDGRTVVALGLYQSVFIFERPSEGWRSTDVVSDYFSARGGTDADISHDGSTLVISGQDSGDFSGYARGMVFVYKREGSAWSERGDAWPRHNLGVRRGETTYGAGWAVAISADGSTVAASAPYDDTDRQDGGTVFVWDDIENSGAGIASRPARLVDPLPSTRMIGHNGLDVSADGSVVATSTNWPNWAGGHPGTVQVFDRLGPAWNGSGRLTPAARTQASVPAVRDGFGWGLALSADGNTLLASAPGNDSNVDARPLGLYAFKRGTFLPRTSITTSPAAPDGENGWYVSPVRPVVATDDGPAGPGIVETRCVIDPAVVPRSIADLPATPCDLGPMQTGTHDVYAASVDTLGNVGSIGRARFSVRVDTVAPTLQLPGPMTVDADAAGDGAHVSYAVSATDDHAARAPACTPASNSRFPVGVTEVRCVVRDDAGNTDEGSFEVTVLPPQEPVRRPGEDDPARRPGEDDPARRPGEDDPARRPGEDDPARRPADEEPVKGPVDVRPGTTVVEGPGAAGDPTGSPGIRIRQLRLTQRRLHVHVSAPARLTIMVKRCTTARTRARASCRGVFVVRRAAKRAGTVRVALPRSLPAGRYKVTVAASTGAGRRASTGASFVLR